MRVTLKTSRVVLALAAMVTLLTIANVVLLWVKHRWRHDHVFGLTPLFDFNREGNLPAFYSACSLLLAAVLALVIAGEAWDRKDRWRRHWLALGAILVFLAIDEAAELHGLLSPPLRELTDMSGALVFAWVIPYAVLTLLFAAAYRRFFWALPRRQQALLGSAGVIYVLGALGLELIGGSIVSAQGGLERGLDHWAHAVSYSVEELLEMTGVVILIYALLQQIAQQRISLSLDVSVG